MYDILLVLHVLVMLGITFSIYGLADSHFPWKYKMMHDSIWNAELKQQQQNETIFFCFPFQWKNHFPLTQIQWILH